MKQDKKEGSRGRRAAFCAACVFGALALAAGAFTAGWYGRYYAIDGRMRDLMWAVDTTEEQFYTELDEDAIYDALFDALRPDAYSRYYSKAEYGKVLRESEGNNTGSGISLTSVQGGLPLVYSVVGNSPACLAGVERGMTVFSFGETEDALQSGTASQWTSFQSAHADGYYLRCGFEADGSDAETRYITCGDYLASYTLYRDSGAQFVFRGKDELVLTETEGALAGADGKTAYLRIDEFDGNVVREVFGMLDLMRARGRENLILDLRCNGGGYLDDMVAIASRLMRNAPESHPLVLTAKFRSGKTERYVAERSDFAAYFPADARFTVLADEHTASASEALIGALVDYGTVSFSDILLRDNGTDVPATYGKGIMQSHFRDGDGNVMKLTVATVHWPLSDRCVQFDKLTAASGAQSVAAPLLWRAGADPMLQAALDAIS